MWSQLSEPEAVSHQDPTPQPLSSAAAAKVLKRLPTPVVPAAASSLAPSSAGALRWHVGVIRWRCVRQLGGGAVDLLGPLLCTRTAPGCTSISPETAVSNSVSAAMVSAVREGEKKVDFSFSSSQVDCLYLYRRASTS